MTTLYNAALNTTINSMTDNLKETVPSSILETLRPHFGDFRLQLGCSTTGCSGSRNVDQRTRVIMNGRDPKAMASSQSRCNFIKQEEAFLERSTSKTQ